VKAPDDGLRRRYRRLLTTYPAQFRAQHGEEMLAVMLDAARAGQRFPTPRDTADIVAHGLLARLRAHRLDSATVSVDEHPLTFSDAWARSVVHGFGPLPISAWTIPAWLRRSALVFAGLLTAVAALAGVIYVFYDHALAGYSGSASANGAVARTTYHGLPLRSAGAAVTTLNLRSVTPRVTLNTAQATVRVLVCTGPQTAAGPLDYGATSEQAPVDCATLAPLHSGILRLGQTSGYQTSGVVVAVTPRRAGTVRIEGADVHYRQGIRFGHQHVGVDWTLHVR
jgi:hypothetical protein